MITLPPQLTRALDQRTHGVELGPYAITIERDLRVPMDDGVELLGDLYRPVGADGSLPTVVIRGPYGRRGYIGGVARMLAYEGFLVFFQSCRGTWGSGGVFTPQIDEQRDGIATLRWVRKQPWFTGRLATVGQSYMGYTQWAVAGATHSTDPENAPEALVLQITMPDFGAITWDNGAFSLRNALGWSRLMDLMGRGGLALAGMLSDRKLVKAFDVLPLGKGDSAVVGHPIPWYQDWVRHERLTDDYWTRQSHTASVPQVTSPVLMVTGWYDIFLPWQLRNYRQLVEAGNPPLLTVGPWGHMSRGMAAPTHRDTVEFLKHTLAEGKSQRAASVRVYQTGANQWHDFDIWPPVGASAQPWLLHSGGGLSTEAGPNGVTRYTYDPDNATPSVGGPGLGVGVQSTPVDNSAHEQRADVAVFRSAPLATPLDLAGEPVAHIRFRSSAPSYDVFVRITDVHPDGRSMTVCDGIRRIGSIGTAPTDPPPDDDGFRNVAVPLWPTFHHFAAGHRVGVQVGSGAHPRYARNPGTGEPAFDASTTIVAQQEISHAEHDGSRVDLPVWTR